MKELKDLRDLLGHEIQVLYDGEVLLIAGLERMIKKANNAELKVAFQQHKEETQRHKVRLEQAAKILGISPEGDGNPSMKGLLVEGEKVMHKDATPETLDAALIAGAQKVEHYEICGYGTAAWYSAELGFEEITQLLRQTLEEEKATDEKLNMLATTKINLKAEHPATH
jgi:ferritin-like metal-binding protein YciE